MNTSTRPTVTIASLEAERQLNKPVWALNNSIESKAKSAAEVHIGIPKSNGTKIDDLFLPQTWLPICLTDQIPLGQLLDSSEFRNAVNSKVLKLITAEHAALLGESEGAEEERERIEEKKQQVADAGAARTIQDSGAEIVSMAELAERNRGGVEAIQAKVDPVKDPKALDPGFMMFVETLKSKPDIECLNLIRSRNSAKKSEVLFMLEKLKGKDKVTAFLKQFVS